MAELVRQFRGERCYALTVESRESSVRRAGLRSCLSSAGDYIFPMQNGHGSAVLDEMLEPVSQCFGMETARALAALRVNERTQARVEELAEKCNEGQLSPDERAEYEAYVQASTLIGILQAKARRVLAQTKAA